MSAYTQVFVTLLLFSATQSFAKSSSTQITPDTLEAHSFIFHVEVEKLNKQYVFTVTIKSKNGEFSVGTEKIPGTSVELTRPIKSLFHSGAGTATGTFRPLEFQATDDTLACSFRVSLKELEIRQISFSLSQLMFSDTGPGSALLPFASDDYFFVLADFLPEIKALQPSSPIAVTISEDHSSDNRKGNEIPDVVGTWRSARNTLSIYPDMRFKFNGGPKIEYGIWEESIDGGFYLRYRARNKGEAGLSRAGHFVFEQGDIVFYHDDEVERFEKVGRPEVTEKNGIEGSEALAGSVGTVKLRDEFSKRVALCLKDFEKLKPGMSRIEISRIFPMDGGIQGISPVRFAHPDCPYFKFDVEFEFKTNSDDQNRPIRGDNDRATTISKPYIEAPYLD